MFKKTALLLSVFIITLIAIAYSLSAKIARAQVPPPKVPCGESRDPEFHSLRPYQASPCGDSDKALFCGNNIIITETASGSTTDCDATELEVDKLIQKTYVIDLKETELPILGNTEQVKNSQGGGDEFDDATKVNEYASWYLSGVNNRAEYGENTDDKTVNFSGPVQKLLPGAIQDAQRILTIESVKKTTVFLDEAETRTREEPENHNQIVVCESGGKPVECPNGEKRRLLDWDDGDLSFFNTFFNWLGTDQWNKKYPPLPWQFKEEILYQKAYQEWRGNTCAIIFGKLVCTENLFVPNKWANLFQYVPLANTVDKNAKVIVIGGHAQIQPMGDTTLSPIRRNDLLEEPALFFSHTREDKDLSESLNKTYIPKEGTDNSVNPETSEINTGTTLGQCRVVNVRSNEGDNLFAEVDPNQYRNAVDFTIEKVPCPSECVAHEDPLTGIPWYSKECHGGATITLKTQTKTPFAEDIWKSTVAGGESTFRKIFPKVEEGAPVSCIADLPTVTSATYDPTGGTNKIRVVGPQGGGDGSNAQLFFPHIGSVYEYFLKGIQTALRPQGYGEPITNGQYCKSKVACGDLPAGLPKGSGSCSLGSISSGVGNIPQSLKDIIEAAAQTYNTPPNLILGIMYGEGLFDGNNKKDWTDENVKKWATCEPVPGCSVTGDDHFMGFNGGDFANIAPHIIGDIQKLDPNRKTLSQCNLLDAIYAEAWNLHDSADGGRGIPATCFGIPLGGSTPSSCSWTESEYAAAIKVSENGYNNACFTLIDSCATGGGNSAVCPNGTDSCETKNDRYISQPSHFGCIWDVAHGQ